jgi:hypothetical protein
MYSKQVAIVALMLHIMTFNLEFRYVPGTHGSNNKSFFTGNAEETCTSIPILARASFSSDSTFLNASKRFIYYLVFFFTTIGTIDHL